MVCILSLAIVMCHIHIVSMCGRYESSVTASSLAQVDWPTDMVNKPQSCCRLVQMSLISQQAPFTSEGPSYTCNTQTNKSIFFLEFYHLALIMFNQYRHVVANTLHEINVHTYSKWLLRDNNIYDFSKRFIK